MSEKTRPELSRRRVFAGAGTAGALAAAAALLPKQESAETPQPGPTSEAAQGGGYRVTQHVLHYYRTARV